MNDGTEQLELPLDLPKLDEADEVELEIVDAVETADMAWEEQPLDSGLVMEGDDTGEGDIKWKKRNVQYPDYNPVENLLSKLDRWLLQQPEWAIILVQPRATRRKAIQLMAKHLVTIPQRHKFH